MKKSTRISWVGLDVHKDTIAVCWLHADSQAEETREIPNEERAIRTLFKRLAGEGELRVCYEAGPCGYPVRRQLEQMGIACDVIAPAMIPRRPGDRIKTDSRDARKLARLYRAGELTPIRVPTETEEAVRDLVRCREDLCQDVTRMRHRLLKFLLRHGRIWRDTRNWTDRHWAWLRTQRFVLSAAQRTFDEYVAQLDFGIDRLRALDAEIATVADKEPWKPLVGRLRCLRGIDTLSALTLLVEIQDFRRFRSPRDSSSTTRLPSPCPPAPARSGRRREGFEGRNMGRPGQRTSEATNGESSAGLCGAGLRPGRSARSERGSSRRTTVMRLGSSEQPAHTRVIRRRSAPIARPLPRPPRATGPPANTASTTPEVLTAGCSILVLDVQRRGGEGGAHGVRRLAVHLRVG